MVSRTKSEQLFAEALKHIPGGVNSPVRAFRAVGGQPFFVNRARGAHVWDVDGNEYVDYVGAPPFLGMHIRRSSKQSRPRPKMGPVLAFRIRSK